MAILTVSLLTISIASDKVNYAKENEIEDISNIFYEIEKETSKEVYYTLPLENIKISATFGTRIHPITKEEKFHSGIDLIASEGTKVKASADGVIEVATYDTQKGNYVEIKHKDGSISGYHHGAELLVQVGDIVKAGDEIMLVGKTGMATGAHLHFEIRNANGEYLDVNEMVK